MTVRFLIFCGMFLIWVLSCPIIQSSPLKTIGLTWDSPLSMLSDAYSSVHERTVEQLHLCQAIRSISIGNTWEKTQIFYVVICFHDQSKWTMSRLVGSKLQIHMPACLQIHVIISCRKGPHRINPDFCCAVSENTAPGRYSVPFYSSILT